MPRLGAIAAFLGAEKITIEVGGRDYEFPGEVTGRTGVQLQRLFAAAADPGRPGDAELISDMDHAKIRAEVMGTGEAAMLADGVGSAAINLVWETLLAYHGIGEAASQRVLARGEAVAPVKKRRPRKTAATPSAGANDTPSPGSTSGTNTRPGRTRTARQSPGPSS